MSILPFRSTINNVLSITYLWLSWTVHKASLWNLSLLLKSGTSQEKRTCEQYTSKTKFCRWMLKLSNASAFYRPYRGVSSHRLNNAWGHQFLQVLIFSFPSDLFILSRLSRLSNPCLLVLSYWTVFILNTANHIHPLDKVKSYTVIQSM